MIILQMRLTNKVKGSMLMSITDTLIKEQFEKDRKAKTMNTAKRMIWVTFRKEGIHKYPAALDDPKLATGDWDDVSFLGYPHRHIFHFKVAISVTHNDRDIEFIQFKRWLERLYDDKTLELDYKSCEMMSDDLYTKIDEKYPGREVHIDISEDGENGAHIEYNK
jgi:hypothetical protein